MVWCDEKTTGGEWGVKLRGMAEVLRARASEGSHASVSSEDLLAWSGLLESADKQMAQLRRERDDARELAWRNGAHWQEAERSLEEAQSQLMAMRQRLTRSPQETPGGSEA